MPGSAKFYRSGNVVSPSIDEITVLPTSTRLRFDNSATIYTVLDEVSINSGSISFNGSSQFLTVPNNTAFLFGSADFTIECWIYPLRATSTSALITGIWDGLSNTPQSWNFVIGSSGNLGFVLNTAAFGGNVVLFSGSANDIVNGQWQHVAVTRSGNTWRTFINGVVKQTASNASTLYAGTSPLYVGSYQNKDPSDTPFNGYISNLRITKGQALYTSNFTPKRYVLDATTSTSLLLSSITASEYIRDSSFNNFRVTATGAPTFSTLNPFEVNPGITATSITTTVTTTTSGISVGSMYFNGSSGAIYYPTNTSTVMTGDFTIELFHYKLANTDQEVIRVGRTSYTHASGLGMVFGPTYINIYASTDGANWNVNPSATISVVTNRWYHLAVTRSGSTIRIFVDGVVTTTTTVVSALNWNNPGNTTIGAAGDPGSINVTNGYSSNIRIVNGTALYTSNFSIPATPLTSVTNTVLLLNTVNSSTYRVDSASNFSSTVVGAATRFDPSNPFEGGSIFFNGSSLITIPSNTAFDFGSGNFTVEAWIYTTSITFEQFVYDKRANTSVASPIALALKSSGGTNKIFIIGSTNGSTFNINGTYLTGSITIPINTWVHIAAVRNGTTITGYVNGVSDLVITGVSGALMTNTDAEVIGSAGTSLNTPFNGYISNHRVTKGQALYTSNFTVSISSFTATVDTSLLLAIRNTSTFLVDSSLNKFTVTNSGASASLLSPFNTATSIVTTSTSVTFIGTISQRIVNDGSLLIRGIYNEFDNNIVDDSSLVLYLDAAQTISYPGTGTTWFDISRRGYHHTITGSSAVVTIDNAKCIDISSTARYARKTSSTFTFGSSHTMIAWARPLADSQVSIWRTLWRTSPNDHPLLIQDATNLIGYWDSDTASFNSYGINAGTIGIENKWTMFSLVSTGTSTTLYINDLQHSGTVNFSANGMSHDYIGEAGTQAFGYVAVALLYNRALTTSEISQNFNAFRGRFGI